MFPIDANFFISDAGQHPRLDGAVDSWIRNRHNELKRRLQYQRNKRKHNSLTKDEFLEAVKQLNTETPEVVSLMQAQTEAAAAQSTYFRIKAASEERVQKEAKIDSLRQLIDLETRESRRELLQQRLDKLVDDLYRIVLYL